MEGRFKKNGIRNSGAGTGKRGNRGGKVVGGWSTTRVFGGQSFFYRLGLPRKSGSDDLGFRSHGREGVGLGGGGHGEGLPEIPSTAVLGNMGAFPLLLAKITL